jgi:hypothetical protein
MAQTFDTAVKERLRAVVDGRPVTEAELRKLFEEGQACALIVSGQLERGDRAPESMRPSGRTSRSDEPRSSSETCSSSRSAEASSSPRSASPPRRSSSATTLAANRQSLQPAS